MGITQARVELYTHVITEGKTFRTCKENLPKITSAKMPTCPYLN